MIYKKNILKKKVRSIKLRKKIKNTNFNRLIINRTLKHMYIQVLSLDKTCIISYASTNEKKIKNFLKKNNIYTGNIKSSKILGEIISKRLIKLGIKRIYFDRSGFKFHGRIKALAESLRLNGLIF